MARIGVVFGGRSVEHEVSVRSARTVARALRDGGHEVIPLGIDPGGRWVERTLGERALEGETDRFAGNGGTIADSLRHLLDDPPDAVFPIVHGTWGEDGTLQGFFEILDLPYVGANVEASAVAMDKIRAKRLLEADGLDVVEYCTVLQAEMEGDLDDVLARCGELHFPVFVKPAVGGSSVGVRKVPDSSCLESALRFALQFDDAVLVERGVVGRELECAVLGYESLEASVVGEIIPGKDFYDYEDKYVTDGAELIAPADLTPEEETAIREAAPKAFAALGGTGMARVDFLLEDGRPYVNEINTLPGFTSISMYPRLWGLTGVPLPDLVDRLVDIAFRRHRDRHRLDEGIKSWLAELGPHP